LERLRQLEPDSTVHLTTLATSYFNAGVMHQFRIQIMKGKASAPMTDAAIGDQRMAAKAAYQSAVRFSNFFIIDIFISRRKY